VAVEDMASDLHLSLTDYAYGGAQTGMGNLAGSKLNGTGVAGQVSMFQDTLGGAKADANALYVVWAGPNDFFSGTNMLSTTASTTIAQNFLNDVSNLYALGARDFFVPLMPDLSLTPSAAQTDLTTPGYKAAAAQRTVEYNQLLVSGLANLTGTLPGVNIQTFDTVQFMTQERSLLQGMNFNVTDSCFDKTAGTVCSNPGQYLFWDGVHPTAAAHALLGQAFAAAVPEVSTGWMMVLGLGLMVVWRGRRAAPALNQAPRYAA
jgi:phospholipase/lecithinase/hemolysin